MKRLFAVAALAAACLSGTAFAARDTLTENKNVTVIHAQTTADGKTAMREQVLEECIVSLPPADQLDAQVGSQSTFLREINGDPAKSDFVKTYTAKVDVNYMLFQKALILVTANSVPSQEPIMKIVEKNTKQTMTFQSNPGNGDLYAGKSNRQYYFSTPEGAIQDAKKQAQTWIKQQSAVICKNKTGQ